jgi:hypothetical protein
MDERELQDIEAKIADAGTRQLAAITFAALTRMGELDAGAASDLRNHFALARALMPELYDTSLTGLALASSAARGNSH